MLVIRHVDVANQAVQEQAAAQAAKNQADVDYIAMMTGVEIPEQQEGQDG